MTIKYSISKFVRFIDSCASGKCIVLNVHVREEGSFKINDLSFHLKKLEKEK